MISRPTPLLRYDKQENLLFCWSILTIDFDLDGMSREFSIDIFLILIGIQKLIFFATWYYIMIRQGNVWVSLYATRTWAKIIFWASIDKVFKACKTLDARRWKDFAFWSNSTEKECSLLFDDFVQRTFRRDSLFSWHCSLSDYFSFISAPPW